MIWSAACIDCSMRRGPGTRPRMSDSGSTIWCSIRATWSCGWSTRRPRARIARRRSRASCWHAWRIRASGMVHTLALWRDLPSRDKSVSVPAGAEWQVEEGKNPWKNSEPFSSRGTERLFAARNCDEEAARFRARRLSRTTWRPPRRFICRKWRWAAWGLRRAVRKPTMRGSIRLRRPSVSRPGRGSFTTRSAPRRWIFYPAAEPGDEKRGARRTAAGQAGARGRNAHQDSPDCIASRSPTGPPARQ